MTSSKWARVNLTKSHRRGGFWLMAAAALAWFAANSAIARAPQSPHAIGPTVGLAKGSLVIVGGGELTPEITQKFVALAGGPQANYVVIPTASDDSGLHLDTLAAHFAKQFSVDSAHVSVLHTRDRGVADSEKFVAPLLNANAVWFPGGRQWRLSDAYLGTRTEREVKAVLARGGVVGGSSAGATIQGAFLVRGSVKNNTIMVAERPSHREGFGLLRDSAIDQHLLVRHREDDLVPVIAARPKLLGIGLDQSTAIVVHADEFTVIGASKVAIYDNKDHAGKKYYFLSHGEKFNLATRTAEQ